MGKQWKQCQTLFLVVGVQGGPCLPTHACHLCLVCGPLPFILHAATRMNIFRYSSARGKLPLKTRHGFPDAFRIKSKLLSGVFKPPYWGQGEKGTTEDEMAGWHH